MKKKYLVVMIIIFFICIPKIHAECINDLNGINGVSYRTNGHQNVYLCGYMGTYTTRTSGSGQNCKPTLSDYRESLIKVQFEGNELCFSPQAHGNGSVTVKVSSNCSCTGNEIKKTVNFVLSEWGLSSLQIVGYELTPKFYNGTRNYTVTVPKSVTSVEVNAVANDRGSAIKITGNKDLKIGTNKIVVNVKTPEGVSTEYTVTLTRSTSEDVSGPSSIPDSSSSSSQSSKPTTSSKSSSKSVKTNNDNPETGLSYMYFIFGLGIASIFYIAWYSKKMKVNS